MKRYINELKSAHPERKKKIAQSAAIIVTGIIVVIWLVLVTSQPKETSDPSPNNFFESFGVIIEGGLESFNNIQTKFQETPSLEDMMETLPEENNIDSSEDETQPTSSEAIITNTNTENYGTE